MEMVLSSLLVVLVSLTTLLPPAAPSPLPDRVFIRNETSSSPLTHNKTIADLVQRQTDTIKKIVSNHRIDYPVITRYPPDDKQKNNDNAQLEDLKIKCQHLARLSVSTTTSTTTTPPPRNVTPTGFYVTNEDPPPTTPRPATPVKYIKLEPVILQKTIMSDGRTVYYWHKSIPSQLSPVHFTATTTPPPTTTTTTSTTRSSPSSYNFRNFFPSFYSIGGPESPPPTTTEKAATSDRPEDVQLYQQQLKFVVPVPFVPPDETGVRKPWDIDQYAYYPRPLQPDSVNLQVPYVPTFHVIKAVAVPNQYDSGVGEGV